jgi:hypothetical protein
MGDNIWVITYGCYIHDIGPARTPIGPGLSPHRSRGKMGLPGNPT